MAGPKTDLKAALEQSGGKLSPPEPKVQINGSGRQWNVNRVRLGLGKNL